MAKDKDKAEQNVEATDSRRSDSYVDEWLDYLRDHRPPAIVEFFLAWMVAISCLAYYGYCYLLNSSTRRQGRQPLTVDIKRKDPLSASTLYPKLVEELKLRAPHGSKWTDEQLTSLVRENRSLRQVVSQFMTSEGCEQFPLYEQLDRLWPQLLKFPMPREVYPFSISLIVPAFREDGRSVVDTLEYAWQQARDPGSIQVIVVDAGGCRELDECWENMEVSFGARKLVRRATSGRGPTLNFGAECASGKLLTFVHADALLPADWDISVAATLSDPAAQACAFHFGHNTSPAGLQDKPYPFGIRAVRLLGNLRAKWFYLPYGDHVLSMSSSYFRYVGGFPEQPMMEDFELMDFLRKRALVMREESVRIVPGQSAQCSVRRWQSFGVVYVTLVNALMVQRYQHHGWVAQDIFEYYYQRPRKKKD